MQEVLSASKCGGELFLNQSTAEGFLESPNFPEPYPLGQQCSWLLQTSEFGRISLEFERSVFDFMGSDSIPMCFGNNVEVRYRKDLANSGAK